jgi:hypothetical protein
MKRVIRLLIAATFVISAVAIPAIAQDTPPITVDELLDIIDLNTSLKQIHGSIAAGEPVATDRYYLLTGTVTAITTVDPDPAAFYSVVDFLTAEWSDGEIRSYPALLVFLDGAFAERLPQRPLRDPGPEVILNNTRGMALAEFYDVEEFPNGDLVPIFIVSVYKSLE